MSKSTLLRIDRWFDALRFIDFFASNGFDCSCEKLKHRTICNEVFVEITQNLDDSGNGFCDKERYERIQKQIVRQGLRKKKMGWSDQKIQNWKEQKTTNEILPMILGAKRWIVFIQLALSYFEAKEIAFLIVWNNESLAQIALLESNISNINTVSPVDLILSEMYKLQVFK